MMNRRVLFLLVFMIFICCFTLHSASHYSLFVKYYKTKNTRLALKHIRLAHQQKPDNHGYTYWYGIMLQKTKQYRQSIPIFKMVKTKHLKLPIIWYLAQAYQKIKNLNAAKKVLLKSFKYPENKGRWKQHLYNMLVGILIKTGKVHELVKLESQILQYFKKLPLKSSKWLKYKICQFYLKKAISFAKQKKEGNAAVYYKHCRRMFAKKMGNLKKYIRLYNYALVYSKQKMYKKAVHLLLALPADRKTQAIYWHLTNAHIKTKKLSKAIYFLKKGLSTKHQKTSWNKHFYYKLLQLMVKIKDEKGILSIEKKALAYLFSIRAKHAYWHAYMVAKFYRDKAFLMMYKEKIKQAEFFFTKSIDLYYKGLGKYKKHFNLKKLKYLKKVNLYWGKNKNRAAKAYQHKFLFIVFKHINAHWIDKNGKKQHTKYSIKDSVISTYKPAYSQFKKIMFYLTRGKIHLNFKTIIFPCTVRNIRYGKWRSAKGANGKSLQEVDVYSPVEQTITPDPGPVFYKNRNLYDSFVTVFPSKGITGVCTGGMSSLSYSPYLQRSRVSRGRISMASTSMGPNSAGTLIHEFFHNVEGAYRKWNKWTSHVYGPLFRNYWPSWYRGEGELEYYKKFFNRIVFPNSIKRLNFRKKKDPTSRKEYMKKRKLISLYSITTLKKAKKIYNRGQQLIWRKKKYKQGIHFLKQSLKLLPESAKTHEQLAYGYYKIKNFKKSVIHYQRCLKLGQKTRWRLEMTGFLLRKTGQFIKSATYYGMLYRRFPQRHGYLYNQAISFNSAKKYSRTVSCYIRYLKNHGRQKFAQYALNNAASILLHKLKNHYNTKKVVSKFWKLVARKKMAPYTAVTMAIACGESGDKKNARLWLERAKRLGYKHKGNLKYYLRKYR